MLEDKVDAAMNEYNINPTAQAVDSLMKLDLPAGVDINIKL